MAGPTIIAIGTEEQKQMFLPGILSGDVIWCQGYSEPGAGSDLASLQTRAVRDGDDWVVNGQKIWTSGAHRADWMILPTRTDPDAPKHQGIPTSSPACTPPGVSGQTLYNMAESHEFNEVFFEDPRIPSRNILGKVNCGWYGAVITLDFERSSIGSAVGMQQDVEDIIRFAREHRGEGLSTLPHNPQLRLELSERYWEAHTARLISYRIVSMQDQNISRTMRPPWPSSMPAMHVLGAAWPDR